MTLQEAKQNNPQSHTKDHEESRMRFVALCVTLWTGEKR